MCCSQCLAKSGAMVMRGADTRSAVPPAILGMTAPMAHMEEGCEASPWVGSLPCPFQPGRIPDALHRDNQGCSECLGLGFPMASARVQRCVDHKCSAKPL